MRHRRRARARNKARNEALSTIRSTLHSATKLNAESAKTVFNVGLYVLLLDEDLAFFTDDLIGAIGERRRAFLAKQEAILLYEAGEDLPQLLGREFRAAVRTLGASQEQVENLNAVSSELNRYWQTNRDFLGSIRNALAAHRDHDTLVYADGLDALRPLDVMARAAGLSKPLERLVELLTEMASLVNSPAAILKDMMASRNTTTG